MIHDGGVGADSCENIVLGQLVVLRHLDAAEQVRNAGNTKQRELLDEVSGNADHVAEILLAFGIVEQSEQFLAVFIVDGNNHIRVLDIVDPRYVLVADAFDSVPAETVVQQGRTLERFADGELAARILLFQIIACAHGASRTGGERSAEEMTVLTLDLLNDFADGMTGYLIMPEGVAHFFKLVEDHNVGTLS